jgi:hypothetical protein
VEHTPPIVSEEKEDEENLVPDSRHDEEVDRDDLLHVVLEEGAPGGGVRLATADHVLLDGRLGNVDPDLSQLAHDPRRAPDRIG